MDSGLSLSPISQSSWTSLLTTFADATYEQTTSYGEAVWGRQRARHIAVRRGSEIVAAVQVLLFRPPGLSRGLAYVKNGPLWIKKGSVPNPDHALAALRAIVSKLTDSGRYYVVVQPPPHPVHVKVIPEALVHAGFQLRNVVDHAQRYLVDLGLCEARQRSSLGQKWRYNLKQSEKFGLEIDVVSGSEGLGRFDALHANMLERKAIKEATWYPMLSDVCGLLPEALVPQVVLVQHNGNDVAGAVVGGVGETAQYLFGASTAEGTRLRSGYALQWWLVRRLTKLGYRRYDLGGDVGDSGLRQFKTGLVGRQGYIVHLPGEYYCCRDFTSRAIAETAFGARALGGCVRRLADGFIVDALKPMKT